MRIGRIELIHYIEPVQKIKRVKYVKRVKQAENKIKSEDINRVAVIRDERLGKYIDITIEGPIDEKNSYCYWV